MRLLSWIITIPLALVLISFAVSNRQEVVLRLWPLPFELQMPLFLAVLGALVLGFVAGGFVAWNADRPYRRTAKLQTKRVEHLDRELQAAHRREQEAEQRLVELRREATAALAAPDQGTAGEVAAR